MTSQKEAARRVMLREEFAEFMLSYREEVPGRSRDKFVEGRRIRCTGMVLMDLESARYVERYGTAFRPIR